MGGKTKLLDPQRLEQLYSASRGYEHRVNGAMQAIQKQLVILSELTIQRSMSGSRGAALRKAVSQAGDAIEALKLNFEETKRSIEAKLAGAVHLPPARAASYARTRIAEAHLRK